MKTCIACSEASSYHSDASQKIQRTLQRHRCAWRDEKSIQANGHKEQAPDKRNFACLAWDMEKEGEEEGGEMHSKLRGSPSPVNQ